MSHDEPQAYLLAVKVLTHDQQHYYYCHCLGQHWHCLSANEILAAAHCSVHYHGMWDCHKQQQHQECDDDGWLLVACQ